MASNPEMAMTRADLIAAMRKIIDADLFDPEGGHAAVDRLLIRYIDDPKVTEMFERMEKWYA